MSLEERYMQGIEEENKLIETVEYIQGQIESYESHPAPSEDEIIYLDALRKVYTKLNEDLSELSQGLNMDERLF